MADSVRDACLAGDVAAIMSVASANVSALWLADSDGRHALHWACTSSQSGTGPVAFRFGAGVDGASVLRALLALPGVASHLNDGDESRWTPLMIATSGGKTEAVLALLRAGASADCRTESGQIALHYHKVGV